MSPNTTQKQVTDLIKRSEKILVMPSSPPDGDSIGSAIALYLALHKLEKDVTVVCRDAIPELLHFLPNVKVVGNQMASSTDFVISLNTKNVDIADIKTSREGNAFNIVLTPREGRITEDNITFNKGEVDYDLIITVDTAELSQLGDLYENNTELFHQIPVINIDHHVSNTHFGKINCVDIMASSTTELLLPILEELAHEESVDLIDSDVATLLLTGIITDTGSFQNANTTPKSFAKAAQLISYGARQQEIIQHIYKTKQLSQLKLWGRVLTKIETDEKHRIVWSVVTQQDFKDTESMEEQTGDIIDELMTNAPGAEVIFLMKEKEDGTASVSLRTTSPSIDASAIAETFGGGGHAQAAGFRISGKSVKDAEYEVIMKMREVQAERLGIIDEKAQAEEAPAEPMIDVEELMHRAKEAEKANQALNVNDEVKEEAPVVSEEPAGEKVVEEKPKKKAKKAPDFKPKAPKTQAGDSADVSYRFED